MSQLIRVTSTPYQAVHFSQRAQLVPSGMVDVERRRAVARQIAFHSKHTKGASIDMESYQKIRRTFSPSPGSQAPAQTARPVSFSDSQPQTASRPAADVSTEAYKGAESQMMSVASSVDAVSSQNVPSKYEAAYDVQLASFELRAARGDISYLPGFDVTVVIQRPEIHFEYLGGFNYVPPQEDAIGRNVNLYI